MKQACVEAIAQTLGRQPKADELKNIEDRIKEAVSMCTERMPKKAKVVFLMRCSNIHGCSRTGTPACGS